MAIIAPFFAAPTRAFQVEAAGGVKERRRNRTYPAWGFSCGEASSIEGN
jgi:hypothetical protein